MNDTTRNTGLPGRDDLSATDIDPRFDDAAAGTGAPRSSDPSSAKTPWQQFDDLTAACGEWVRGKPMQALAVAAGLGFLLGRSGR